jgi:hypothetical protein
MNSVNLFKNTTGEVLIIQRSQLALQPNEYIELYGNTLSEAIDNQMISWISAGQVVYNDGQNDYDPSEAIAVLTKDTFSYDKVTGIATVPKNRQMLCFQRVTVSSGGRLIVRGRMRIL